MEAGTSFLVIGMVAVDLIAKSDAPIQLGTSNLGSVTISPGGVANNMATCLKLLGNSPTMISAIGNDSSGKFLLGHLTSVGFSCEAILTSPTGNTACYHATHQNDGEMLVGVNDMTVIDYLDRAILTDYLQKYLADDKIKMVAFDANLTVDALATICELCHRFNKPTWFNPTSVYKCYRVIDGGVFDKITFMSPNIRELQILAQRLKPDVDLGDKDACTSVLISAGLKHLFLTEGEKGVTVVTNTQKKSFPALHVSNIVNVTGAGDSFASGVMHVLCSSLDDLFIPSEATLAKAVAFGLECAKSTLQSEEAVNPNLGKVLHHDQNN